MINKHHDSVLLNKHTSIIWICPHPLLSDKKIGRVRSITVWTSAAPERLFPNKPIYSFVLSLHEHLAWSTLWILNKPNWPLKDMIRYSSRLLYCCSYINPCCQILCSWGPNCGHAVLLKTRYWNAVKIWDYQVLTCLDYQSSQYDFEQFVNAGISKWCIFISSILLYYGS